MKFDTSNYTPITEDQFIRFINITPGQETKTWALVAAVEEDGATIEYNPNVDRLKLIVNQNAITNHNSNDKQMNTNYLAYKGDPCFTFVNAGRDKLNYKTELLEVDLWDATNDSYSAKLNEATLVVTSYHGNTIEFDLYADGDITEGKVTITGGIPTFTESASL